MLRNELVGTLAQGDVVVEAGSLREAAMLGAFDRALLDLELEDGTGVEVARALLASAPSCRVAFFSSATAGKLVDRALAIGPVFHKPAELALAVAWLRGGPPAAP